MNSPSPISSETSLTAITSSPKTFVTPLEDDLRHRLTLLPSARESAVRAVRGSRRARTRACAAGPAPSRSRPEQRRADHRRRRAARGRGRAARPRSPLDPLEERRDRRCGRSRRRARPRRRVAASAAGGSRSPPSRRSRRPGGRRARAPRRRRSAAASNMTGGELGQRAARRARRGGWPPSLPRPAQAEVRGHARAERVRRPATVLGPDRVPQRQLAEVAAAAPVARDRAERREPEGPAVGRDARSSSSRSRRRRRRPTGARCRHAARRRCRCARRPRTVHPARSQPAQRSAGRRRGGRRRRGRTPRGRRRAAVGIDPGVARRRPRADRAGDAAPRDAGSCPAAVVARRRARGARARCRRGARARRRSSRRRRRRRERRGAPHGSSSSSSIVDEGTRRASRSPSTIAGRARRRSRPATCGAGRRLRRRARATPATRRRDRRARCATAPSPPARRASARCGSPGRPDAAARARRRSPRRTGSGTRAAGPRRCVSMTARCASTMSAPEPVVGAAAASARGSASGCRPGARRRRCAGRSSGCDSAHRPCTKNVARTPASPSVSRTRSALPGGHHGRSGCSASNVSATRNCRHSRVVTFDARMYAPGSRPRSDGEPPRQELRGKDAHRGRERTVERTDVDPRGRPSGGVAGLDHDARPRRPGPTSSAARARSRSRVSGSVAIDDGGEIGAGELERPVAELRRLERLDRHPHGLLERERAHLGRGACGPAAEEQASCDRPSRRSASSLGERLVGQRVARSRPRPARRSAPSASERPPESAPANARPTAASATSAAANVIVEGPVLVTGARCRAPGRPASASVFASPFVTASDERGPPPRDRKRLDQPHDLRALAGLADGDEHGASRSIARRKCSSSAASSISAGTPARASSVTAG